VDVSGLGQASEVALSRSRSQPSLSLSRFTMSSAPPPLRAPSGPSPGPPAPLRPQAQYPNPASHPTYSQPSMYPPPQKSTKETPAVVSWTGSLLFASFRAWERREEVVYIDIKIYSALLLNFVYFLDLSRALKADRFPLSSPRLPTSRLSLSLLNSTTENSKDSWIESLPTRPTGGWLQQVFWFSLR